MSNFIKNILRRLDHKINHESLKSAFAYIDKKIFHLTGDRVCTRVTRKILNLESHGSLLNFFTYYSLISNKREKFETTGKWRRYIDEKGERERFLKCPSGSFRVLLEPQDVPSQTCKHCGQLFENTSHILWDCHDAQEFWNKYKNETEVGSSKQFLTNHEQFKETILTGDFQTSTDTDLQSKEQFIFLITLAKVYLSVCHRVGVKPFYLEYRMGIVSDKSFYKFEGSGFKNKNHWNNYWGKWPSCPLPPPKGKSLFYHFFFFLFNISIFYKFVKYINTYDENEDFF